MPELLFHKYDPTLEVPTLSKAEVMARFAKLDLVDWRPDGSAWGEQELHNARFRLIKWAAIPVSVCQQLMGPSVPTLDSVTHVQQTYPLQRLAWFNSQDASIATAFPTFTAWWADDTRATPFFTFVSKTITQNVSTLIANKTLTAYP